MGATDRDDGPSPRGVYNILDDLHAQLLDGKAATIRGIGKALLLREDKGQQMSFAEFRDTVTGTLGLSLDGKELAKVFSSYADEKTGVMDFNRFLGGVRGELSPDRQQLIDQVYMLLDAEGAGCISVDTVRAYYNAACNQDVMEGHCSAAEATEQFVLGLYGEDTEKPLSHTELLEYYAQLSFGIPDDSIFELIVYKAWKIASDGFDVDQALNKLQVIVYKNRIRLQEFFQDFDKLRCGYITETQLYSGLSMAGIRLTEREMAGLADCFKELRPTFRVHFRTFCDVVDSVFTIKNLEKTPTLSVNREPAELLDKDRFQRPGLFLTEEEEGRLEEIYAKLRDTCFIKRIMVKPFFDDFSKNQNSVRQVGHVTVSQFKQVLDSKLQFHLAPDDLHLIVAKHESAKGMVNYIAFANMIDPSEQKINAFSLK